MRPQIVVAAMTLAAFLFIPTAQAADDLSSRLNALEAQLGQQMQLIQSQQQIINALKAEVASLKGPLPAQPEAQAPAPATKISGMFGSSAATNPSISLILDTFGYSSNLTNEQLENRGIPGFTTNGSEPSEGFNLRAAELVLFAPVDPYANLYATLPVTEDGIELEEAFAVTTALPAGLQLKGGKFKSNFSRLNSQHPHAWDFFDIALPYRAFLGDEGLGGEKGAQLTWLPAWPVYIQFGTEVLQGENELLFGGDAASGPHAFTLFAKGSIDTSDNSTLYLGPSVLFGKTRSGNIVSEAEFDGDSALYGMEAVWKWKPSNREALTLQGEYLYLDQDGDVVADALPSLESLHRQQDGFYVQGIYQLDRWRFGVRIDTLELFADDFKVAGAQQDLGDTPWRASGAIEFNPSEFTQIRLQFNHDRSARDGRGNNEAILQFLFGIGAHAAHPF